MAVDHKDFPHVRQRELEAISAAREAQGLGTRKLSDDLFGVAFSGGGIRSATFNLGVLQALAEAKLLHRIDYLSTVSGGGYIGSWFSAWIKRLKGGAEEAATKLNDSIGGGSSEPEEISWLRRYSNYLTPRVGFFSTDTLAAVATYVRNLLLNQIELVALLGAVLTLPYLLAWALQNGGVPWLEIGLIAYAVSLWFIDLNLYNPEAPPGGTRPPFYQSRLGVYTLVVVPLCIGAAALGFAALLEPFSGPATFLREYGVLAFALTVGIQLLSFLYHVFRREGLAEGSRAVRDTVKSLARTPPATEHPSFSYGPAGWLRIGVALIVAVPVGLLGLGLFRWALPGGLAASTALWHAVVLALPAAILAFGLATVLFVGIASRTFTEATREWWSRLGGVMLGIVLAWLVVAATAVYGPYLVERLSDWVAGLSVAWIVSTVGGVLAGRSGTTGGPQSKRWLDWIARVAPYVFIVGLLLALSYGLQRGLVAWTGLDDSVVALLIQASETAGAFNLYAEGLSVLIGVGSWVVLCSALGALLAVMLLLAATIDVNVFSLHMFYRNRLVRCYLGASNQRQRKAQPFTGFDPNDTPRVESLVQRPYHLVNTAINLTRSRNLAWQERKAASFVISPLFCGYDVSPTRGDGQRYQETLAYLDQGRLQSGMPRRGWITLGNALAISGAAASPNMGFHTSPALAFLMTVFNVRLGWWMQNTNSLRNWTRKGPRWGIFWLLQELLAMTDEERSFVYLSDGGHFENLGIYELARRRCRFILASDAGQDGGFRFDDLGNAVRKCQIDLGVRIDVRTSTIIPDPETGASLFHCAIGDIDYPKRDGEGAAKGLLLYIKPSLTGDEPPDVRQYAKKSPAFPHEPTADQWFDESQFESYRKLGHHVVSTVLDPVRGFDDLESKFVTLKQHWYTPSRTASATFARHGEKLQQIEATLRSQPELKFLDGQLFPEWSHLMAGAMPPVPVWLGLPSTYDERRAGFYACANMLQLMENVYLDVNLEVDMDHPDNRGWINLFRHWSWSAMFMATYSICCGMSGARFQRWCERYLNLYPGTVKLEVHDRPAADADVTGWLADLERRGLINFVEAELLAPRNGRAREWFRAGDRLVLLQMVCRPQPDFPAHRGGGEDLLRYTFGIAVVRDGGGSGAGGQALTFFRIQDHVRRMGLARRAMRELVRGEYPGIRVSSAAFSEFPAKQSVERTLYSVISETPEQV